MKYFIYFLMLIGITSCDSKYTITEKPTDCVIDSVQYHGVGSDNTLQVSPYWKLHLKEPDMWMELQQILLQDLQVLYLVMV